ncbi:MAG: class I SAM-dependent methyltransferase, partial [Acidimicrobiales bacterium]
MTQSLAPQAEQASRSPADVYDEQFVPALFRPWGPVLCDAARVGPGQRVLDVACGNGNAALAAARRFCQVVGVDYGPALLERARWRAEAEGLEATFQEGDAEALPFPDDAFDVVLSTCGAMFAPDQERTASELLRVCRPGGRIGMVNWTPDSYVGELFQA